MRQYAVAAVSTRERILDGALELIAEQGLLAVTNRNLARRAGVSLGSLTYHFESQEELLRETLLRFVEAESVRLTAVADELRGGADPSQAAATVQAMLSQEAERRLAKLELYLYAARHPGLHDAAERCFAAYDDVVRAAATALGAPDGGDLASTAVAVIDGLQVRRLATGGRRELPAADALALVFRGAQAVGED